MMSIKRDRVLIEMARSNHNVEQIAAKIKTTPKVVFLAGQRLGIYFPPLTREQKGQRTFKRR